LTIVRQQLSAPQAMLKAANVDSDQWTMTGYWNKERPFHVIALNDPRGSEYYVSVASGEVVMGTHRTQRVLNWLGAIPHWLYFESLRRYTHVAVWAWSIYIIAGASILVSLSGLWIGISRMRLRMRYTNGSWTPFTGWMKWHHVTGIVGGVFLALWIISGFFTMYPGGFLEQREMETAEFERYAGNVQPEFSLDALAHIQAAAGQASRVTLRYVGGHPIAVLENPTARPVVIDALTGAPAPLSVGQIAAAAKSILPDAKLISATYLEHGDEYWHSAYQRKKTPIVRVIFDDPEATWFHIDPESGEVLDLLDKTGRVNRWTVVAIHDVDLNWLLTRRPLWDVILFALTIPGILIAISTLVISYRRLQRNNLIPAFAPGGGFHGIGGWPTREANKVRPSAVAADSVLVAYASQTGTAEILANKTADGFRLAGLPVDVRSVGDLEASDLMQASRAIFIISTTGDGDAPDRSMPFQRRIMRGDMSLSSLRYAMLALGDRQYSGFCSFGSALDSWLVERGAQRLFPTVQVNDRDPQALRQWSRDLGNLTGRIDDFVLTEEPFRPWRLIERRHANPGSVGGAVFHLCFEAENGSAEWQAGDIAQIAAGQSWTDFRAGVRGLIQREFSIANTADSGRIELLVRCMRTENGQAGVASGFLTTCLELGEAIPLRVRRNPSFHGPTDDRPMLMIGNGTGIAGLRAHLQRRVSLRHRRNWLIFGERNAAHDTFYADELLQWRAAGDLERLDLVFSRDQAARSYVQDRLLQLEAEVRAWTDAGAAIYVCGSVRGMAPGVHDSLATILGEDRLEFLARNGRYVRDVY
jgi:sulfite reductase (NADPH) flavoprotein alpha-component